MAQEKLEAVMERIVALTSERDKLAEGLII